MQYRNHLFQSRARLQRGGTVVGFIIGVLVGLGIAFGVTAYVSKMPIPFLTDTSSRLGGSGVERHRGWDPNAPLYGKNAGQVAPAPRPAEPPAPEPASRAEPITATTVAPVVIATTPPQQQPASPAPGAEVVRPKPSPASTDPLGDLAAARDAADRAKHASAQPLAGGSGYFVQAGAFRNRADADAQRAKLNMLGHEARITEREQNGRPVYRVRVGPFGGRDDAEGIKRSLDGAGVDAALVRVQ